MHFRWNHLLQPSQRIPFWLERTGFVHTSQGHFQRGFLRVVDNPGDNDCPGPGFISMSPHCTNLEILNVETELGYRVRSVPKYPFARVPRWRTRDVSATKKFRVVSKPMTPPTGCRQVLGWDSRILKKVKLLQAKRQTKKTVRTGERENLQPAAMTTADKLQFVYNMAAKATTKRGLLPGYFESLQQKESKER